MITRNNVSVPRLLEETVACDQGKDILRSVGLLLEI